MLIVSLAMIVSTINPVDVETYSLEYRLPPSSEKYRENGAPAAGQRRFLIGDWINVRTVSDLMMRELMTATPIRLAQRNKQSWRSKERRKWPTAVVLPWRVW